MASGHDKQHRHSGGSSPQESHAAHEHKSKAPSQVAAYVITCSDSRDEKSDDTGQTILKALEGAGHQTCGYRLVRDEPESIRAAIEAAVASGARALILNGGTGIGRRDNTV